MIPPPAELADLKDRLAHKDQRIAELLAYAREPEPADDSGRVLVVLGDDGPACAFCRGKLPRRGLEQHAGYCQEMKSAL
jgi:hypothetical protein